MLPFSRAGLWAWDMRPTMTAMVMGGGYLSGAYFFYRAATVGQWHRIGLGAAVFLDADPAAVAVGPQPRHDPHILDPQRPPGSHAGQEGHGRRRCRPTQRRRGDVLRPDRHRRPRPLDADPLTCRSLAAFATFPSIIYLAFAFEKRWSSFQILIEVAIAGMVLIGIAAIRAHAKFDGDPVVVWGWRIGLAVALVLLIALRVAMAKPDRPLSFEPREV